ncbi:hypothetical protein CCHR01_15502 [Colletotrichum chrysophilum]|uniref:Uncharacterized protein n=1 Tax=Colletotrichum chrysophilum TaxID=1836956 RepID=A0AAD9EAY2_9PEZI|nr:hypothetical protein CCHR01_15502 [Colletotrichum chrysophilum]
MARQHRNTTASRRMECFWPSGYFETSTGADKWVPSKLSPQRERVMGGEEGPPLSCTRALLSLDGGQKYCWGPNRIPSTPRLPCT